MKVKDMIKILEKMDQEAIVVYSIDDEVNGFEEVTFHPSEGKYLENQFVDNDTLEEFHDDFEHMKKGKDAVCIN